MFEESIFKCNDNKDKHEFRGYGATQNIKIGDEDFDNSCKLDCSNSSHTSHSSHNAYPPHS